MVRPGAKFIVVLRDPTDRYCSGIYMALAQTSVPYKMLHCVGYGFVLATPDAAFRERRITFQVFEIEKGVFHGAGFFACTVSACGKHKQRAMILR